MGKTIINNLSKTSNGRHTLSRLAKDSPHVAVNGQVVIKNVWMFNKIKDNPKLKPDGSNFFQIAKPLKKTTASLDRQAGMFDGIKNWMDNNKQKYQQKGLDERAKQDEAIRRLNGLPPNAPLQNQGPSKPSVTQEQAQALSDKLSAHFGVPKATVIFQTLPNGDQGGKYNRIQKGKIYIDPDLAARAVYGGIMGAVAHEFGHYLQDVYDTIYPVKLSPQDVQKYTAICEQRQDSRKGLETFAYWLQYNYKKFG